MNQSGHILIIDDEASLRQTLARILQRAGFEATTAANAKDGLIMLQNHSFDMVYLDIRMPDMSGLEALKIIKTRYPEIPVILFTAQPDISSAIDAIRSGATDYMLKPLKPDAIIEGTKSIMSMLARERRRNEIQLQIDQLQAELKSIEGQEETTQNQEFDLYETRERYIKRGNIKLDLHSYRVTIGTQVINLPPATFNYLLVLARHEPEVVDYQTLVAEATGYQTDIREARELVKWHIHHLRDALEQDVRNPQFIINIRGVGYRLLTH